MLVAVSTPRAFDPVIVSRILTDAANGHEDVLKKPAPSVFFKKIGDAQLDFELVCFVADVDLIGRVTSDLHFIVFREIVAKQPALDPPRLKVEGLGGVEGALGGIAESIARAPSGGTPAPSAEVKP
ncbi:MAG: hypothetical protein BGP06_21200 [Rhizobiales bacterium 65-9]|nr:MAG: hypothetical protein BGP06_21200 [Rhizobiales bacterium 65-9]